MRIHAGKNRLTFVFQYRIKLNIKNKDHSFEMKTIMWQTCLNVLKNKEVSRIRKKSRYIDFWRYFPSILINGVLRSKYITKLHYHKTDAIVFHIIIQTSVQLTRNC